MGSKLATWPGRAAAAPSTGSTWGLFEACKNLRRNARVRPVIVQIFRALQRAGINITPRHFYWPIPDLRQLEQRTWPVVSQMNGIDLRLDRQADFLRRVLPRFAAELDFPAEPTDCSWAYHRNNGLFETVDAEMAYCMVRHLQPRRVIEIGGGFSTRVIAAGLRRNAEEGRAGELITIDPHPRPELQRGFPGLSTLIARPVQEVAMDLFRSLGKDDILFIDSSHVVAVGSDVVYEYLEILPRMQPGVVIHVHDIFLPADYPRSAVLEGLCFWSEQYLLQALLTFGSGLEVLWASSAMYLMKSAVLDAAFPALENSYSLMPADIRQFQASVDGKRVWPSSFWMRRVD